MDCPSCGRTLEPGMRFCPACGTPIPERACAGCGAALPADARFCPACGTPTSSAAGGPPAAEPARERKMATMLFADLVGSTALAERHDPEIVARLVGSLFERVADEVRRYEGTIAGWRRAAPCPRVDEVADQLRRVSTGRSAQHELRRLDDHGRPVVR